jgi:hypothetical protein
MPRIGREASPTRLWNLCRHRPACPLTERQANHVLEGDLRPGAVPGPHKSAGVIPAWADAGAMTCPGSGGPWPPRR